MSDVRSDATFFERFARGEVAEQQIDDFISAWHDGDGGGLSLHEYLGFTWPEYQEWVMESGALARILARRRAGGGQPAS
ncbi:MAG: hypothetical protein ACREFY_19200 [Acetobacteraceae bacterium]